MLAGGEYYAYSCHPADVWASINKNRENIMFIDVQARGYYPNYALKMFEREGINIGITTEDKEILKNNPVDFILLVIIHHVVFQHKEMLKKLLEMLLRELKTPI